MFLQPSRENPAVFFDSAMRDSIPQNEASFSGEDHQSYTIGTNTYLSIEDYRTDMNYPTFAGFDYDFLSQCNLPESQELQLTSPPTLDSLSTSFYSVVPGPSSGTEEFRSPFESGHSSSVWPVATGPDFY
jgi:hypothetical protein